MRPISKDLYPFTGKHFDRGGGFRMHYLDEGAGDPVVMVHGNPTWSFYYRDLVLALRDQFRCIVPDHIGCGMSDKPGDDAYRYVLESRVDDLEALLDSLGVTQNITLVVHDWGGMIGFTYATRHSERIRRIVVLNTAAFRLPDTKPFPWPLWIVRNTWVGAFSVQRFNAFSSIASRVCCTRKKLPADVRAGYTAPYDTFKNRIATLRFVQDIPLRPGDPSYNVVTETESKLPSLSEIPMLICWGLRDFVFDKHFLAVWQRHFPNAAVHRFDDGGHYILEDASEEVIPLIRRFVETT